MGWMVWSVRRMSMSSSDLLCNFNTSNYKNYNYLTKLLDIQWSHVVFSTSVQSELPPGTDNITEVVITRNTDIFLFGQDEMGVGVIFHFDWNSILLTSFPFLNPNVSPTQEWMKDRVLFQNIESQPIQTTLLNCKMALLGFAEDEWRCIKVMLVIRVSTVRED